MLLKNINTPSKYSDCFVRVDLNTGGRHRVRTVMENLEKSRNFKMVISRPGKVKEKNLNHKSFGKVMEICYNHIIFAEFEIINMFFKERRSKY